MLQQTRRRNGDRLLYALDGELSQRSSAGRRRPADRAQGVGRTRLLCARARNAHAAAQQLVAEHGGQLPADRRQLLRLPGIGEYTVGAILSMAFNQPEPILDGNVKRVLARLCDIGDPVDAPATLRELWRLARLLVETAPPDAAGACNEALMELGATVCTPQSPRCLLCPLVDLCLAAARGTQADRPVMPPRKTTPHYDVAAGVIWQGEPFASPLLIAQRPHKGLLGGLWEFPGGKQEATDVDLPACLRREIMEELGIAIEVGRAGDGGASRLHPLSNYAARVSHQTCRRRTAGARLR
ncbi:MAG: NUDIX domain-containing protein [Tetrasphaera sp.]